MKDPAQAEQTIEQIEAVEGTDGVRADEAVISRLIQIQHVFTSWRWPWWSAWRLFRSLSFPIR